jgi:hypothetical protein
MGRTYFRAGSGSLSFCLSQSHCILLSAIQSFHSRWPLVPGFGTAKCFQFLGLLHGYAACNLLVAWKGRFPHAFWLGSNWSHVWTPLPKEHQVPRSLTAAYLPPRRSQFRDLVYLRRKNPTPFPTRKCWTKCSCEIYGMTRDGRLQQDKPRRFTLRMNSANVKRKEISTPSQLPGVQTLFALSWLARRTRRMCPNSLESPKLAWGCTKAFGGPQTRLGVPNRGCPTSSGNSERGSQYPGDISFEFWPFRILDSPVLSDWCVGHSMPRMEA